jgi:hypothetical protein
MDYTMSVYLPEIAMQGQQATKQELSKKSGLDDFNERTKTREQSTPLLL